MSLEVSKAVLQRLADEKLRDAKILLYQKAASNAYYLAGYSVEMALKACIAKNFKSDTIPDKDLVRDTYSHNLKNLVATADLQSTMLAKQKANQLFAAYWAVVNLWNPESRYNAATQIQAAEIITAIEDSSNGVLPWIKQHW